MKRAVLILVVAAVVAVIAYKLTTGGREQTPPQAAPPAAAASPASAQTTAQSKATFYLFHDPSDQDAGCRLIYAFADRAERELGDRVEVRRPDVEREKGVVEQYQVKVLPTIVIVSPEGKVEGRFEGEEGETAEQINQALTKLKNAPRS